MKREVIAYGDYYDDFMRTLSPVERKKIHYILDLLQSQDRIVKKFVKLIRDGLYELRAMYNGNIYRIFFIFDEDKIVVLFNGFQKKTQKTPESEIKKALRIKRNIMTVKKIRSVSAELDELYGKEGTPERDAFRREAYVYYTGQIIEQARINAKMTQEELAVKVGTNKSYISRVETGKTEPKVSTFYKIVSALGLSVELTPVV